MGLRVNYGDISTDSETEESSCSNCIATNLGSTAKQAAPTKTTHTTKATTHKLNSNKDQICNVITSSSSSSSSSAAYGKNLIDNNKEYRIENNNKALSIVGNNNRIKITNNNAHLQIIGNNTKLKIIENNGTVKYTGNNGRIYFGNESKQQSIDYIGCNGILKIVKSTDLMKTRNQANKNPNAISDDNNKNSNQDNFQRPNIVVNKNNLNLPLYYNTVALSTTTQQQQQQSWPPMRRHKVKSASYGGDRDTNSRDWQELNELIQQKYSKVSLPNLNENNFNRMCNCKCNCLNASKKAMRINCHDQSNAEKHQQKPEVQSDSNANNRHTLNTTQHIGNIVINNSINVTISPKIHF